MRISFGNNTIWRVFFAAHPVRDDVSLFILNLHPSCAGLCRRYAEIQLAEMLAAVPGTTLLAV
jgi:hypothetical protein